MDCNADIQNKPAASYIYEQEEDDDADDDDTFENHCDIEDQATVERSRSSTSLTSNSFSAMSNKLLNSNSTADITTSDCQENKMDCWEICYLIVAKVKPCASNHHSSSSYSMVDTSQSFSSQNVR